jgi:EpsI family protein
VAAFDLLAAQLESVARKGEGMIKLLVALAFLGLNFYTYHYLATKPVIPDRQLFRDFPDQLGDWICDKREAMDDATLSNLGATDFLLCTFRNQESNDLVNVYVGYHATQVREEGGGSGDNAIHPPAHCLPGSGWDIIDNQLVALDMPGLPQTPAIVKRLVIARGNDRQITYYWYQSQGRVISQDWKKILLVGYDRAFRGRTDGSLIRFTLPIRRDDEATAEANFRDFAPRVVALIPAYVPE